jgi:threonine aldolase
MRQAIYDAELGDDVFGEDPTTIRLEKMAAQRMGKEAALLVASGTMANLVCALTHCRRGEEAILGDRSHTFLYEAGGMSALGGIHPHTVPNQPDGTMRLEDIAAAIRGANVHFPRTRLICLENTHNRCYGSALTCEYTETVAALAGERGLRVHLDGARIFNAAVALGVDAC